MGWGGGKLYTFMRRRSGVDSWETPKRFGILLIKNSHYGRSKSQKQKEFANFDNKSSILRVTGDLWMVRNSY